MQHNISLNNDQALQAARVHLRARRWREAEALANRWLQRQPDSADAASIRAIVGLANGQAQAAQELIVAALALNNQSAFAYFALAQLYLSQSKPDQAESSLRRALSLAPADAEAHCQLASLLAVRGDVDAAQQQIRHALQLIPDSALLHLALAEQLLPLGQLEAAAASATTGLALEPSLGQGWILAAGIATLQGQWLHARQCCDQALLVEPDNPLFLTELARVLFLAGSQPWANARLLEEAELTSRQALILLPQSFAAQLILGGALRGLGRTNEALAVQAALVRLAPQDPVPVLEIALTQCQTRSLDTALLAAEHALLLAPELPQTLKVKSDILLLRGELTAAFEALDKLDGQLRPGIARLTAPCTEQSLCATTILLHSQTMQQVLLFARYVPQLSALGAQVSIAANPQLHELLPKLAGVHQWLPPDADPQAFTFVEPMHRLPALFPALPGSETNSPPWTGPYCHCNSDDLAALKKQFLAFPAKRIGLNLGPSPDASLAALLVDMFNTLDVTVVTMSPLAQLEPLFDGVALEFALSSNPATLATLVQALDCVICVDSLLAHIAGAMGADCHLLLPLEHDSLWGAVGKDTNWYPASRLYRQSRHGGWQPAIALLQGRLAPPLNQEPT